MSRAARESCRHGKNEENDSSIYGDYDITFTFVR